MPGASIRLVRKRVCQRFVGAPALGQARGLDERRAHQRMPEANRLQIGVDNARGGSGRDRVEIDRGPGDRARRFEDFADAILVIQCGHEQHGASRLGEVERAASKRVLEALGERERTSHRRFIVSQARDGRKLDEGERAVQRAGGGGVDTTDLPTGEADTGREGQGGTGQGTDEETVGSAERTAAWIESQARYLTAIRAKDWPRALQAYPDTTPSSQDPHRPGRLPGRAVQDQVQRVLRPVRAQRNQHRAVCLRLEVARHHPG